MSNRTGASGTGGRIRASGGSQSPRILARPVRALAHPCGIRQRIQSSARFTHPGSRPRCRAANRTGTNEQGADGGRILSTVRFLLRRVVGLVRFAARQRGRLPGWVNRALDWIRWRMPQGWANALTGRARIRGDWDPPEARIRPPVPDAPVRLLIGPANFAGQGGFGFPSDYSVSTLVYRRNSRWQRDQFSYLTSGFTHVIAEVGRPICGWLHGGDPL